MARRKVCSFWSRVLLLLLIIMAFWALLCLALAWELRGLPMPQQPQAQAWWGVRYGPRHLSDLDLEMAVVHEGARAVCGMGEVMQCGSFRGRWESRSFELSDGKVLRWHLHFHKPPEVLELSAWLPSAAVEGHVDGCPVVARRRPAVGRLEATCEVSSSFPGRGCERLLDEDTETEWFAGKGQREAWVVLDLGGDLEVTELSFSFWAKSSEWLLESRAEGASWIRRGAQGASEQFNEKLQLEGWKTPSRWLRLSLRKGHLDPWNFGVFFGLRSFLVMGRDEASSVGAAAAWGASSAASVAPGLWLALEHPRSRCRVEGAPQRRGRVPEPVWRKATCRLRLTERNLELTASLGVFEDGQYSQLRRSFAGYLEQARGRPFGQNLHYNSWYDLRSSSCEHCHPMTEEVCLQRLEAFNGNLSRSNKGGLDAFLLDDGWDDVDSLWEIDGRRFPGGFEGLVSAAQRWGTRLGVWMSPFGGYGENGLRRLTFGQARGYERSKRGGFALAGAKYLRSFTAVVRKRLEEGFGIFKFDGLGGGLGQSGGEEDREDFEAMLQMIQELREEKEMWISLTIGTWPSPFWLLWADSIWRDGPDVGSEGTGAARDRWLKFRDSALRRALARGPLFPLTALMQHGIVWSKTAETAEMWPSAKPREDFCHEVVSFFLSGTGLQELYIQLELMDSHLWKILSEVSHFARQELQLLRDSHAIRLQDCYGTAALQHAGARERGLFWLRNPTAEPKTVELQPAQILELPERLLPLAWKLMPLPLGCLEDEENHVEKVEALSSVKLLLRPFQVAAWTLERA